MMPIETTLTWIRSWDEDRVRTKKCSVRFWVYELKIFAASEAALMRR